MSASQPTEVWDSYWSFRTPGHAPRFTQKWFVSQARQLYQRIGAAELRANEPAGINLVVSRCSPKRRPPELAVSEFPIVPHNQSAIRHTLGHHISDREHTGYTKVQWLGGRLGAVLTDPLPPPLRTRYQASSGSTAMSPLPSSGLVLWDWLL
jgi:hypothetical protein